MVRDVFVEIRENQQQLEHPLPLLGVWIGRLFLEILDDSQSIREKPFEVPRIHGVPLPATSKGVIRADKCLIEEMIEAQSFRRESGWDRVGAGDPSAISGRWRVHGAPHSLPGRHPRARGRETTTVFRKGRHTGGVP